MKKQIRYTANDDHYHQQSRQPLPWIVREILGFCAGFTLVSFIMLLVLMGWQ